MYNLIYPYLIQFAMILNSGLYVVSVVFDRQEGMRYILNFHGIKNIPYMLGVTMADFSIASIPAALLVLFGLILDLDVFKNYGGELFLSLIIFNFPFIMLVNIFGFLFSKSETAFKYILLIVFVVHTLIIIIQTQVDPDL